MSCRAAAAHFATLVLTIAVFGELDATYLSRHKHEQGYVAQLADHLLVPPLVGDKEVT